MYLKYIRMHTCFCLLHSFNLDVDDFFPEQHNNQQDCSLSLGSVRKVIIDWITDCGRYLPDSPYYRLDHVLFDGLWSM